METIIALLVFFSFLYVMEKISNKKQQELEMEMEEKCLTENPFTDNCPYCNTKVKHKEEKCNYCHQQLNWE